MQKAIPKHRPAKNPASQKAKQSPTKNRFKFQNNNPKTGRRALARRPVFGRRACAPRCCFEICIDFLLDFAWLFGWLDSLLAYALGWLSHGFLADRKKQFSKSGTKKHFFPNRFFKTRFQKVFFWSPGSLMTFF